MTVSLFLPVYSQTLLFSHFVRFNIFPHVVRSLSPLGQSFFTSCPSAGFPAYPRSLGPHTQSLPDARCAAAAEATSLQGCSQHPW